MQENFGKKAKRLLCGLLAFVVLAGYLPAPSVFAAEGEDGTDEIVVQEAPLASFSEETSENENSDAQSEEEDIIEGRSGGIVPADEAAPEDGETPDEAVDEEPAAEPAGAEPPAAEENVSEEVQAFLNAVAKLPDVIGSAEDYDAVEAAMQDILPLFQALTEEDYDQDGVSAAQEKLVSLQEQLGMGRPVEAAYDKWANWDGNITFRAGQPRSWTNGPERDGGSIEKLIYEDGFYAFRAISTKKCPYLYCGHIFGTSLGKEYLISGFGYEYDNAAGVIGDDIYIAVAPVLLDGVQSPAITFTTQKLGTDTIWVDFFVNFHSRWNSNSASCPSCWRTVTTKPDDSWYLYTDYFEIIVKARYTLEYNGNATGVTNVPAAASQDTTATSTAFSVATVKPTREGYKFLGWSEDPNATTATYTGGERIILNWSEGYGSSANPVSKTLYAIWEEKEPEKAPEAPKREDLYGILRAFVEVECVSEGDGLPHDSKMYSTAGNQNDVTIGEVQKGADGKYTCVVTVHGAVYAAYYGNEPAFGTGVPHKLADDEEAAKTFTLTWDAATQEWISGSVQNTALATFMVVCRVCLYRPASVLLRTARSDTC